MLQGNAMKDDNTESFFNSPDGNAHGDETKARRHGVLEQVQEITDVPTVEGTRSSTPLAPLNSPFFNENNSSVNIYENEGGAMTSGRASASERVRSDTLHCPGQPTNPRMSAYSDFDSFPQNTTGVHSQYQSEPFFSLDHDQSMYNYYYGHHNTHGGMPSNAVNLSAMQSEQFSRKDSAGKRLCNTQNATKTIAPSSEHPQPPNLMAMKKTSLATIGSKQLNSFLGGDSSNIAGVAQSGLIYSREQHASENASEYSVRFPGAINSEWRPSRQTGGCHESTLDISQQQQKAPFPSPPFRSPYTTVHDSGSLAGLNGNTTTIQLEGEKILTDLSNSKSCQPSQLHQRQSHSFHDFNSQFTQTQVPNQTELRNSQNATQKSFPPWSRGVEFGYTPNVTVVSGGKGGPSQFQFHSRSSKLKTDSEKILENHLKKFQHLTSSQERKPPRREKSLFESVLDANDAEGKNVSEKLEVARKNEKICEEESKDCKDGDGERESVFRCKWLGCDVTYSDRNDLVRHIEKVHIDQRKADDLYICYWDSCTRQTKPFNARYKLVIHMRVHSGEKPNKCTVSR